MSNSYVDESDLVINQHYLHFGMAECVVVIVHVTFTNITGTFGSVLYKRKGDKQKEARSGPRANDTGTGRMDVGRKG